MKKKQKGQIPSGGPASINWLNPKMEDSIIKISNYAPPSDQDPGLRFNEGKVRHDLLPAYAINEIAKVFTMGADKYGDDNWTKGMKWTKVLASAKRHINAIERCEDFDEESGLLHASHAATNLIFLLEYYRIAPQFDNRRASFLSHRRVALDIDGVLADFDGSYKDFAGLKTEKSSNWLFSYKVLKEWGKIKNNKQFWLGIKTLINHTDLMVEPACYITARPIPAHWVEEWIEKNNFPCAKVYCVQDPMEKIEILKKEKIDIMVDDRYDSFVEFNKSGIFTYLMDQPYNRRYNVGHRRLKSIKDLTR